MEATTRKPATPSISLPHDLLDELDQVAARRGWKRSFLLREIIKSWLEAERLTDRHYSRNR